MKGEDLKERPEYRLMKQNDIVKFYHLQFPRWLIEDKKYMALSMEAKFIYMLLFNRFQISKHNGWINNNGEVFVIYTRRELAQCLNISEKRISASMNELKEHMLVWEKRRGRGFANQIYLANVELSLDDAISSKGDPLDPSSDDEVRSDETEGLNRCNDSYQQSIVDNDVYNSGKDVDKPVGDDKTALKEAPNYLLQNCQNSGLKTVKTGCKELRFCLPIKKEVSNNHNEYKSSQSMSSLMNKDDMDILERIIEQSELNFLPDDEANIIRHAIERLYFTQSLKIGNAVYPNSYIRSNLKRLDFNVVQTALCKLEGNVSQKIRDSGAYVVTVLFNSIMEVDSDLLVDPYLNFLRQETFQKANGGG